MRKKKITALLLAFLLVFQGLNLVSNIKQVDAAAITDNILKGMKLYEKDHPANVIASVYDGTVGTYPEIRIELGTILSIDYEWELPATHDYKDGDTYTFTLPAQFEVHSGIPERALEGEPSVGTYKLDKATRTVTMKFNENIEQDIVGGTLNFWVFFSEQSVNSKTSVPVYFDVQGGYTYNALIKPNVGTTAVKNGSADKALNPQNITWTIDVNKALEKVDDAVVTDAIPEGLSYNGDLKVYKLDVDVRGNVSNPVLINPPAYTPALPSGPSNVLSVDLGDITGAYRIEFSTKITDYAAEKFNNSATFSGSNITTVPLNKELPNSRGKLLAKSSPSYSSSTQLIDWQIKYNYGEESITNPKLIDLMDKKHEIIPTSIKVYPVSDVNKDTKGTALDAPSQYTVETDISNVTSADINGDSTADKTGFILTFNNPNPVTSAYIIEYQTKPTSSVYDDVDIRNDVYSNNQNAFATRQINQRFYSKSHSNANYADRTIDWNVTLNENKYNINGLKYEDIFESNLKLIPGSLVIKQNGVTVTDSVYTLTYKPGNDTTNTATENGFTVTFPNGNSSYTISYKTSYDFTDGRYNGRYFENKGIWTGTDVDFNYSINKSSSSTFNSGEKTENNGFKEGSYDRLDKVITWGIYVNYNSKTMTGATVEDVLQSVQKLKRDTLEVYELTVNSNGSTTVGAIVPETAYTVTDPTAANGNKLTVAFDEIDRPYYITFKTDVEGQLLDNLTINNEAIFSAQGYAPKTLKASVTVPHAGEYIHKTGLQDDNDPYLLKWTIYINRGQSAIENAEVYDIPSKGQILDKESFILYSTKLDGTGNVVKDAVVDENEYDVVFEPNTDPAINSNETFKLTFKDEIKRPYILEYNSAVDAEDGAVISNNASFKASGVAEKWMNNPSSITIRLSGGSGTGSGLLGSLTVVKTDEETNATLPGATFTLTKNSNNQQVGTPKTSDASGQLEFTGLRYGTYTLKESTAPNGYEKDGTGEYQITINSKTAVYTVTNKALLGSLKVIKKDKDIASMLLPGAEFTLTNNVTNEKFGPLTTGTDGELVFTGLRYGTYTLEETKAPNSHSISGSSTQQVTINQVAVTEVTVLNEAKLGSLKVIKTEKGEPSILLAGAEFTLTDSNNVLVGTKTSGTNGELEFTGLRYGTYTLKETNAPNNYAIIGNGEQQVTIDSVTGVTITVENEPLLGSLKVVKQDKDDASLLQGAEFTLTRNYTNKAVSTQTTDANGEIVFADLPYGTYTLKETKAPYGYAIIGSDEQQVTINSATEVQVDVENQVLLGSLTVVKTARGNSTKLLEGAVFTLTNKATNELIGTQTTDSNGQVTFAGLRYGTYVLKETKAPVGYYVSGTGEMEVEINSVTAQTLNVENSLIPDPTPSPTPSATPSVTPSATPSATPSPSTPVTEPTPAVTPKPTSTPTAPVKVVTNENTPFEGEIDVPEGSTPKGGMDPKNGKVTVTPDGKWTYTPNPGYVGPDRFSIILVHEDGEEEEFWFEIDVEELPLGTIDVPTLPKTGENPAWPLQAVGILLLLTGFAMLVAYRRKHS